MTRNGTPVNLTGQKVLFLARHFSIGKSADVQNVRAEI
jgi:hypothetical protein